jgi:hypothetical protein
MGTSLDKAALEKEWAAAEARLKLNPVDKATWMSLGWTIRPYVYYDKILVAWSLVKGQPQVKDIFQAIAVDASFQGGLWVRLKSKVTDTEIVLTNTPQRLSPTLDIFGWMPFFTEVRYISADWNNLTLPRNMRLNACFKMVDDPMRNPREGKHYLSELHTFRERFPQYSDTRF